MRNTLFIAIFAGIGSMLAWGTADFFAKKTIDEIGDLRTLFWQQLFGIVPLLALFTIVRPNVALHGLEPLGLLSLGVASALLYLLLYAGFAKGQVSLLSPVFASYSVVIVLLSATILHEKLSALRAVALLVTFAGILLISTDVNYLNQSLHKRAFRLAGLSEVVFAMLGYSFWLFFLDRFLEGRQWIFYLLIIRILATTTLYVYARLRHISLGCKDNTLWKYLVCIGIFDVAAFSFVSYGFSNTQYPSIIAVLSAVFSLPTMVLARLFLGEKIQRFQMAAALVIIAGVVLISIS